MAPTEIRWKASLSATCLHAVLCWRRELPPVDPDLASALEEPMGALVREIVDARWAPDELLDLLASLSAEYENNRELVTRALARMRLAALADGTAAMRVAGAIADLEAALRLTAPEVVEELAVRGGPLREQWEAFGPGMLVELRRLTDAPVVPEFAEVVLVSPWVGGHGLAHAAQNRVTLEAVLVNPHPRLPEAVRLAWLVCQLNSDLPRFAEVLPTRRRVAAFRWAMVPPVLAAAATVELVGADEDALASALLAWDLQRELPADAAVRLSQWWNEWLDRPGKWEVAVAALDGMMAT